MDVERLVAELAADGPGIIKRNAPDGTRVTELVREDPPVSAETSTAMAVIERAPPHHHPTMTEVYRVIRGTLELHLGDDTVVLAEGDTATIEPGTVHWGQSDAGDPAWVHVTCHPAFSAEEYVLDPA